jgi:Abnormal spindle-like microcephaly-assoc'd, ASPM-SPD-2-Hydin
MTIFSHCAARALALVFGVTTLGAAPGPAADQPAASIPVLRIVAPIDRTRVAPGERLDVRVQALPGHAVSAVAISGERPIGVTLMRGALPATIPVQIPSSTPSGLYRLTALARDSGQLVSSAPVIVDVERSLPPQRLQIEPRGLSFQALGETLPLRVLGAFAGSPGAEVTRSPDMQYTALDSNVATVNAQGQVTAEGPGSTDIVARYRGGPAASIAVRVSAPAAMISPATIRFGPQPVGVPGASRTVTVTNRSNTPLEITSVQPGGDFAVAEDCLQSSPLPAGGTCYVTVTFTPSVAGQRAGSVTIGTRNSAVATVVRLQGQGELR